MRISSTYGCREHRRQSSACDRAASQRLSCHLSLGIAVAIAVAGGAARADVAANPMAADPAAADAMAADPAADVCDVAAAIAEQEFGIPTGLLAAIGRIESGRWQPLRHRTEPWPYTIDVGGYDLFMDSAAAGAEQVRQLRAQGTDSIDVGCFQVNLFYHPDAFATLEDGFDPLANARYAARFLIELKARTGSWDSAVADYHSAVPELGEPYRAKVYAVWTGQAPDVAGGAGTLTAAAGAPAGWPYHVSALVRAASAGSVIAGVRVIIPSAAAVTAYRSPVRVIVPVAYAPAATVRAPRGRLPRVFGPTGGT